MLKKLLLAVLLLATGIGPARADEAGEFLATVKAQTEKAKADLKIIKKKAAADTEMVKKVIVETRTTCEQFIATAEELTKAEAGAQKEAQALKEAKIQAAELAAAARVQKLDARKVDVVVSMPPRSESRPWEIDESPVVTRKRVVETCKAVLAKLPSSPLTANQPASAPPPAAVPKMVPFRRW